VVSGGLEPSCGGQWPVCWWAGGRAAVWWGGGLAGCWEVAQQAIGQWLSRPPLAIVIPVFLMEVSQQKMR
jgi:hypothetical protein